MARGLTLPRPTALDTAVLGAVVAAPLPWLGRWSDLADLAAQFLIQGALLVAALAGLCLLLRRGRHAVVCLACLALQLGALQPGWVPSGWRSAAAAPQSGSRVLVFNVWAHNHQPAKTLRYIREVEPDTLVLVEVFEHWRSVVDALQATYPTRVDCLEIPGCDVVILSRLPLLDGSATRDPQTGTPLVQARLRLGERAITVAGTHLTRPVGVGTLAQQMTQVEWLSKRLDRIEGPFILTGDFNAVGWGRVIGVLSGETGLKALPTLNGTYHGDLAWPLRIPIDHVLVSPELTAAERQTGPALGSDHRPVLIDLPPV